MTRRERDPYDASGPGDESWMRRQDDFFEERSAKMAPHEQEQSLVGYDLFLLHTDKHGNSYAQQHRVWNGETFVTARKADARKEGDLAGVAVITEQEFRERQRSAR